LSPLLKSGSIAGGIGVAGFIAALPGGFGPCGPASPIGLFGLLAALFCVPGGLGLCLSAGIVAIVKRKPRPTD
jgi:hypothetical protein